MLAASFHWQIESVPFPKHHVDGSPFPERQLSMLGKGLFCQLARQLDWSPRALGAQPSGLPAALTGPPSSRHSGRVSEKSWSGSVTLPHHWISTGTSANPGLVLSFKGALKECVGTRKIVKLNTCVQDSYCLF